jgi:hypothetical protein
MSSRAPFLFLPLKFSSYLLLFNPQPTQHPTCPFKIKIFQKEMIKLHKLVVKGQESLYEGPLTKELFNDFDSLFELDDGARLQLSTIAGGEPVDIILVDCLMYAHMHRQLPAEDSRAYVAHILFESILLSIIYITLMFVKGTKMTISSRLL